MEFQKINSPYPMGSLKHFRKFDPAIWPCSCSEHISIYIYILAKTFFKYRVSQKTWEFSDEFDIVFVMN